MNDLPLPSWADPSHPLTQELDAALASLPCQAAPTTDRAPMSEGAAIVAALRIIARPAHIGYEDQARLHQVLEDAGFAGPCIYAGPLSSTNLICNHGTERCPITHGKAS